MRGPLPVKLEDLPSWRASILIAIEDPGLRVQVEETLRLDGHTVTAVEDGVELLEAVSDPEAAARIQLVVADVALSGFTGLEVLGMTDGQPGRPPMLMLADQVDLAMRRAARQFGASSILAKPFDVDDLRLVVGALLRPTYRSAVAAQPLRAA